MDELIANQRAQRITERIQCLVGLATGQLPHLQRPPVGDCRIISEVEENLAILQCDMVPKPGYDLGLNQHLQH